MGVSAGRKESADDGDGDHTEVGRDLNGDSGDGVWTRGGAMEAVTKGGEEDEGGLEGDEVPAAEFDSDEVILKLPVLSSSGATVAVVVVVVGAVVVVCPLRWPLSLDLSLDLSLGLLVPTGRRETWISPLASAPTISPLPSSSPLLFSSPRLLSSPRFFFPLPLPPLPPALWATVCSFLLPA